MFVAGSFNSCKLKRFVEQPYRNLLLSSLASSTWNISWLWNTNKGRPQKQVQKATWKFVDNFIK